MHNKINSGAWVNKTGRRIWVIQLDKDIGAGLAATRFDMHDDGQPTQQGTALATHLNSIPTGRVVLIGVYDSGFNSSTNEWNEAAYNAMEKLGAQKIRRLDFRDSYALVTVSGSPHNTIELHKKYVQRTSTSAECGIGARILPQATVQYRYNAAGQRIYKQVGSNPAEHYVLDEDKILGVFRGAGLLYWNIYGNDGVANEYPCRAGSANQCLHLSRGRFECVGKTLEEVEVGSVYANCCAAALGQVKQAL